MLGRIILLFLFSFPLLVGCQTVTEVEQPHVAVENIEFGGGGGLLDQRMILTVRLTNPNDFDIPIDGLKAQMEVNGRPFAYGVSNYRTTLPRLSSTVIPLEATISMMDLVRQILSLGQTRSLDYVLYGDVFVVGQSFRSVPFEKTGNFTLGP